MLRDSQADVGFGQRAPWTTLQILGGQPGPVEYISNQVAQRSNQVTTVQCFSANDMPDMYYDLLQILFSNFVSTQK